MTVDSIITMGGTVVTILIAAFHANGRFVALETKVDLLLRGMQLSRRELEKLKEST